MESKVIEILTKVFELFHSLGIRNVSMDDISRELKISKKTLYKYFESKADLISKLLDFEQERFDNKVETDVFDQVNGNAIDVLLAVSKTVAETYAEVSPRTLFEMKKYFPEQNEEFWKNRIEYIVNKVSKNFQKGIEEGIYRQNLHIDLESRLYAHRLRLIHLDESFANDLEAFKPEAIFSCFFESLIRSISNKKGIEYFESKKKEMGLIAEQI